MKIETLSKKIPLSINPYDAFGLLSNNGQEPNTALLETAEAGTHANQKSIVMSSAAAKISCFDRIVKVTAYNQNGQGIIKNIIESKLFSHYHLDEAVQELSITIDTQEENINEYQKLISPSSFDVLRVVQSLIGSHNAEEDQTSCLIGTIGFDCVDQFEDLPVVNKVDEDYCFYVADEMLIQDFTTKTAKIVVKGFDENADNIIHLGVKLEKIEQKLSRIQMHQSYQSQENKSFQVDIDEKQFALLINKAKQHILEGDIFQVVLARTFTTPCQSAYAAYGALRESNPSPYMYYINFSDKELFGASPESALKISATRQVSLYPIAGTRKRAVDANDYKNIDYDKDSRIEFELINDQKESAEHMMLVDLARNDLAKVVKSQTRFISQLKQVVKYSHVMHMVSEVKGTLLDSIDALHAYRACANMGTLTGAPKIKAMQIIRQQEQKPRGLYGGAVCLFNAAGEFDSAIIIRSAVVRDKVATVTAGAGIVYDSQVQLEVNETQHKAQAVLNACHYKNKQNDNNKECAA